MIIENCVWRINFEMLSLTSDFKNIAPDAHQTPARRNTPGVRHTSDVIICYHAPDVQYESSYVGSDNESTYTVWKQALQPKKWQKNTQKSSKIALLFCGITVA